MYQTGTFISIRTASLTKLSLGKAKSFPVYWQNIALGLHVLFSSAAQPLALDGHDNFGDRIVRRVSNCQCKCWNSQVYWSIGIKDKIIKWSQKIESCQIKENFNLAPDKTSVMIHWQPSEVHLSRVCEIQTSVRVNFDSVDTYAKRRSSPQKRIAINDCQSAVVDVYDMYLPFLRVACYQTGHRLKQSISILV